MTGDIPIDFEQSETGKTVVAPERFKSSGEISDCCNAMVMADRHRVGWRASIDGLINGNPLYRLSTMKAAGQGWRARANYREAEGLIQARQTPFYDLVSEVNPCVEICLDYGKGVDQTDWANAMAKYFHWMLMKMWRSGFNFHIPLQQLEMLKHGIGYHVWPGSKDCWIPRTPLSGQVLFPDGVSLNIHEDLDYFMLRDFLPGHALYRYIQNEEAAGRIGWNVKAVWNALAQTSKNKQTSDNRWNTEIFQREMKSGDIGTTQSRQSGLWLNHLFVKEVESGKISQYTVAETVTPNAGKDGKDKFASCLFRKRDRFDKWPVVIFPYDVGTGGLLHTVRGLGARTKDFFELSNRLRNAMADQVLMGSRMNVKQTGDADADQLKMMRIGMMNILPRGVEPMPGLQFPPLAQGPIALLQDLKQTLSSNNESYMQGTPEPVDRETAQSFTMRSQNMGQVGKGVHSLYASNYQQLLDRMFRIASRASAAVGNSYSAQLAKQFQDKCTEAGVPREAFQHVYEVNEIFSTGAGSAAARIDALMTVMKFIYPTTSEARKINIERDLVATVVSSSKVDRYARSLDDNDLPNSDASLAVQENNGMAQDGDALVASTQDHVQHAQQHLQKAQEVATAALQGQADPAQALSIIQKFGQHIAQHLQILQQNPMRKAEFDALHQQWLALSQIADKLQQQVQQAQQAQARAPQVPQETISDNLKIGMAKVQADERLGGAKLASQNRLDIGNLRLEAGVHRARLAIEAGQRNGAAEKKAA